jgi:hypothetical protein
VFPALALPKTVDTLEERAAFGMISDDEVNYQRVAFGMHN